MYLLLDSFAGIRHLKKKKEAAFFLQSKRIQGHLICGGKEGLRVGDPARSRSGGKSSRIAEPRRTAPARAQRPETRHARDLGDSGSGGTRITSHGRKCYRLKIISFL